MVTAAAAWAIWGNDIFPEQADPTGGRSFNHPDPTIFRANVAADPEQWTVDEMRRWLRVVCPILGLTPSLHDKVT